MPNTQSAKKALRQNISRRKRNLERAGETKTVIKKYKNLITQNKKDEAAKELSNVYKKLDKLAKSGYIKKNKANRLKSRLARRSS